jgi:hypothetical protein
VNGGGAGAGDAKINAKRKEAAAEHESEVMEDTMSVADGLVRLCGPSTTQLR